MSLVPGLLLAATLLIGDTPPSTTPTIVVVDLEGNEPHHLIVILNGDPVKVTSIPVGTFPGPNPPNPGPGPDPSPSPVPPPVPGPTPDDIKPIQGVVWVTYIQPSSPSVEDAAPVGSSDILGLIKPGSVEWRAQAVGDAELGRRQLNDEAKDAPVTIFQDSKGKIVKRLKGNDPKAIVTVIKALKGLK